MQTGEEERWYLQRLNLFAGLTPAEIAVVSREMRGFARRRGEPISGPAAPSDRIYLVKRGAVRLYRLRAEGTAVTLAVRWPGQLFGTSALAGAGEQPALAEALEEAAPGEMHPRVFLDLVASHPRFAQNTMRTLAGQILRLQQRLARLAVADLPSRVAQILLRLAEAGPGQQPPKPNELTQQEPAELVGTTRHAITQTLMPFAERGLVEPGHRQATIIDRGGLPREPTGTDQEPESDVVSFSPRCFRRPVSPHVAGPPHR